MLRKALFKNTVGNWQIWLALGGLAVLTVASLLGLPDWTKLFGTAMSLGAITLAVFSFGMSAGAVRGRKKPVFHIEQADLIWIPQGSLLLLKSEVLAKKTPEGWYVEGRGPFKADDLLTENDFPARLVMIE